MYCKYYIQFNWAIFICDILFPAGAPIVLPASRGVKYLSNFTWLLYLSIRLLVLLLGYISEERTVLFTPYIFIST